MPVWLIDSEGLIDGVGDGSNSSGGGGGGDNRGSGWLKGRVD